MAEVSIRKLNKMFDVTHVVKDVDLEIRKIPHIAFVTVGERTIRQPLAAPIERCHCETSCA